jgi:hypothetical protein
MERGSFGSVINCIDGRTQAPAQRFLRDRFAVDVVDSITEAGPIRILAEGFPFAAVESIKERLRVSIDGHGSQKVAVVAHESCAGNPVDREVQMVQLERSIRRISDWFPGVEVIGLWIAPVDGVWVPVEVE